MTENPKSTTSFSEENVHSWVEEALDKEVKPGNENITVNQNVYAPNPQANQEIHQAPQSFQAPSPPSRPAMSQTTVGADGRLVQAEQQREAEQERREAEADQRSQQQELASLEGKKRSLLTKLTSWRERKLQAARNAPNFLLRIVLWLVFAGLYVVDLTVGAVPYIGDFTAGFIGLSVWLLISILLVNFSPVRAALGFYLGDFIIGALLDVVPGVGTMASFIVDAAYEPVMAVIRRKKTPPQAYIDSIKETWPERKQDIEARYEEKKERIMQQAEEEKEGILSGIKHHISRLSNEDGQRAVFLFLFCIITLLGPGSYRLGVLTLDIFNIARAQIYILLSAILVLYLCQRFQVITPGQMTRLIFWMVFHGAHLYILQGLTAADSFFGIGIGVLSMFFVFLFGITFGLGIKTQYIVSIMIVLLLAIFIMRAGFYLTSSEGKAELERIQVEAAAQEENLNLMDQVKLWFAREKLIGNGELIDKQFERSHEYVGIQIDKVVAQKKQFFTNDHIKIDIDYVSNVPFSTEIYTGCVIEGVAIGEVNPAAVEITSVTQPTTQCTFPPLPAGSYRVDVVAIHTYESTARIPLKIMHKSFADALTRLSQEERSQVSPETYVGGEEPVITNSGPIAIGAETSAQKLQTPLIYDTNNPRLASLKVQFEDTDPSGSIYTIREANFNIPQGLGLQNCDLGTLSAPKPAGVGRKQYSLSVNAIDLSSYTTFSCDLLVEDGSTIGREWSAQSAYFTIVYDYRIKHAEAIQVIG